MMPISGFVLPCTTQDRISASRRETAAPFPSVQHAPEAPAAA